MENQKQIPIIQILGVLVFLIASLSYTILIIQGWIQVPLALSAAVAAIVAIANGYKWKDLESGIVTTISNSLLAILILITVGMLIGTWVISGIVPAMIYYGLQILTPGIFLVATCIICSIVSLATGSSWTTAATVGIALIGVGTGLGVSLPMTAGAIISGAYFGDKMSPLSDTTNLAPAMAGADLFDHVRHMVFTTGPSFIIALIIYAFLGMGYAGKDMDPTVVNEILKGLSTNFYISPILLIPPVLVILMVVFKTPALPGLFGGVVLGAIFAIIFQGAALGDTFYVAYEGFKPDTGMDFLNMLLERGGIEGMFYSISIVIISLTFGGVLDTTGMLQTLALKMMAKAQSTGSLVFATLASCIAGNLLTGDQYLSIVLSGRMFKHMFEDKRLKPKNLSRCLEDGATITSPLIPWNSCGVYMHGVLGVHPLAYLPFAFLNIINPFISLFYGITGITMEKMTEEEYQDILKQRALENSSS